MTLRKLLFQIHLWVGLSLGLLFIVIGLSGVGMMFRTVPGIGQQVSDLRATAQGTPLALERLVQAARESTGVPRDASATLVLPQKPGDPAAIRFAQPQAAPGPARMPDILVDPVSGKVLGSRATGMTPVMQFIHDLHGQLLMGRTGRLVIGWLGVGMTFLGLSGLYLWWPKKGQWKNAFLVRRKAKGVRFYRELHGAVGIWFFAVFIVVSFTGVAIVFPQTVRAGASVFTGGDTDAPAPVQQRGARAPRVEGVPGAAAIDANAAIALVRRANPAAAVQSVTMPARRNQAITVTVGEGRGTMVFVDPYRASVIANAGTRPQTTLDKIMAVMRPLHQGDGLGPVYRVLVVLSGFLPLLFVITGLMMWAKKRQQRLPTFVPLVPEAAR